VRGGRQWPEDGFVRKKIRDGWASIFIEYALTLTLHSTKQPKNGWRRSILLHTTLFIKTNTPKSVPTLPASSNCRRLSIHYQRNAFLSHQIGTLDI
jgi:hypothetical protein